MKCADILSLFRAGVPLILKCNNEIYKKDSDPDVGMIGRLLNVVVVDPGSEYECYNFVLDFGEFETFNIPLAQSNYYDSNGIPCETWMQQNYYEKDKNKLSIYVNLDEDIFDIYKPIPLINEYLNSRLNENQTYVSWLGEELLKARKGLNPIQLQGRCNRKENSNDTK